MFGMGSSDVYGMGVVLGLVNNAKSGIKGATKDYLDLQKAAGKVDEAAKAAKAGIESGLKLAGGGLVVAGLGAAGIKFGSTMAEAANDIGQAKRDMTSLGLSTAEVNKFMQDVSVIANKRGTAGLAADIKAMGFDLGSAGVPVSEFASSLERIMLMTNTSPGSTPETLKNAFIDMRQAWGSPDKWMGSAPQSYKRYADELAYINKVAKTTGENLGQGLSEGAVSASLAGQSMEAYMAGLGILNTQSLNGTRAANALQFALGRVGEAEDELKIKGTKFSLVDPVTKQARELPVMIQNLATAMGLVGPKATLTSSQDVQLKKMFGETGVEAIRRFLKMRYELVDWYQQITDKNKLAGEAYKQSSERMSDYTLATNRSKNATEAMKEAIGAPLINRYATLIETVNKAKAAISGFVGTHPGSVKYFDTGSWLLTGTGIAMMVVGLAKATVIYGKWIGIPWLLAKINFGLFAIKYTLITSVIPALNAAWIAMAPFLAAAAPFLLLAAAIGGVAYALYKIEQTDWWSAEQERQSKKKLSEHMASAGLPGVEKYMELPPPQAQQAGKPVMGPTGWDTERNVIRALEIPTPTPPPVLSSAGPVNVSMNAPITINATDGKSGRDISREISKFLANDIEMEMLKGMQ